VLTVCLLSSAAAAGPIYLVDAFNEEAGWRVHWRYDPRQGGCREVRVTDAAGRVLGRAVPPGDSCILDRASAGQKVLVAAELDGGATATPCRLTLQDPPGRATTPGRIAVRKGPTGQAEFFNTQTGQTFVVKGFNYIRLRHGDHSTFDADTPATAADYDPLDAESMFRLLARHGYNTVRVFIIGRSRGNPGIAGGPDAAAALYEPYMRNVLDFLRRARRHGVYVLPTFGDGELPANRYWAARRQGLPRGKNALYLTKAGIDAKAEYVTGFLTWIKEQDPALLETLLGVQCQNELYLDARSWPFSETTGSVTAANGKTYDLSDADDRRRLMAEGIRFYHERLTAAVRRVAPGLLVSEGLFVPRAVGKSPATHAAVWPGTTSDPRFPPTAGMLAGSPLDFVDVHFYRTRREETVEEAFRRDMLSTEYLDAAMEPLIRDKPVILGEFGAFQHVEASFDEAVDTLLAIRALAHRHGMAGWMMWTFDAFEQPRLWHAMEDGGAFVERLGQGR